MRPLERLPTIRAKLGSTIVFAVAMTLALVFLLLGYALRATPRAAERLDLIRLASAGAADVAAGRPLPPAGMATLLHVPEPRTSVRALGTELPAFGDGRIHAGAAEGVDYAAVPVGEGSGYVYAVRRVPGEEIADRLAATFRFLTRYSWQFLLAGLVLEPGVDVLDDAVQGLQGELPLLAGGGLGLAPAHHLAGRRAVRAVPRRGLGQHGRVAPASTTRRRG